jgi:hypothetical protein
MGAPLVGSPVQASVLTGGSIKFKGLRPKLQSKRIQMICECRRMHVRMRGMTDWGEHWGRLCDPACPAASARRAPLPPHVQQGMHHSSHAHPSLFWHATVLLPVLTGWWLPPLLLLLQSL